MLTRYAFAPLLLLAGLAPAHATIFKVGPGGTHATIQAAIDAALANPGDDVIKVHGGTFSEGVVITSSSADSLSISGGWDDGYATVSVANATRIRPPVGARGVDVALHGGQLYLSGINVGFANVTTGGGAGLRIAVDGTGKAVVSNCDIVGNVVTIAGGSTAAGGGVYASAIGSGVLQLLDNDIVYNSAVVSGPGSGTASGGGAFVYCAESSKCYVQGNLFELNSLTSVADPAAGAGLYLTAKDTLQVFVARNRYDGQQVTAATVVEGLSANVAAIGTGALNVHAERYLGGGSTPNPSLTREVVIVGSGQGSVQFGDSLVATAVGTPLFATELDTAAVRVRGATIANNARAAEFHQQGSVPVEIENTIIWNPAASSHALFDGTSRTTNLVGVDPHFLAPSLSDYSLRGVASAAIDSGTNAFAVDNQDIAYADRIQDTTIDIGAWESSDRIFADCVDD